MIERTRVNALQEYLYLDHKRRCGLPEPEEGVVLEQMDSLWFEMGQEFRDMAQWAVNADLTEAEAASLRAQAPHRPL